MATVKFMTATETAPILTSGTIGGIGKEATFEEY